MKKEIGILDRKDYDKIIVPIDISKNFHKAMIVGPGGEVLEEPFEIDIYKEGFLKLLNKLKDNQFTQEKKVIFAMEPTSYYHEVMLEQLNALGHEVQLVNPFLTAQVRKLDYDHIKTDNIDCRVLGKTILIGKGKVPRNIGENNKRLRAITRQRQSRCNLIKIIKTQINRHIDQLWPGFVNRYNRKKGLVWNIWESQMAWAIMQICPNPNKVEKMSPENLIKLFKKHRIKQIGIKRAEKIINHAKTVVSKSNPLPEIQENLKQDIHLLHHLNTIVSDLDNKAIKLLPDQAKYLLSIKGLSPFYSASFLAEIGDIKDFASPKQLIRYAGIIISVKESGMYKQNSSRMTKSGNKHLRYVVMTMARNVARCHPDFKYHYEKFIKRGMNYQKAIGCVAIKLMKTMFYLLSREEVYSTDKFKSK